MALLQNVARNLRALSARHGSVYKVCQDLGMAPQQFSHYLNAERLPNEATRKRLCAYFGISEDDLIRPPEGWSQSGLGAAPRQPPPILESMIELTSKPTTLGAGAYFTYFLGAYEPDLVIRSVTVVKKDGDMTLFYRLTGYTAGPGDLLASSKGKHRGIAVEHSHWIYLIGQNTVPTHEPSYLALQWQQTSDRILAGYGIVSTLTGPSPVAVVLKSTGAQLNLRAAIRQGGAFATSDATLDRGVVRILTSLAIQKIWANSDKGFSLNRP